METNLTQLQREAREEFEKVSILDEYTQPGPYGEPIDCSYYRVYRGEGEKYLESLTKKAYLAGLEAAKGAVPMERDFLPTTRLQLLGQGFNSCRLQALEGIEKLTESV